MTATFARRAAGVAAVDGGTAGLPPGSTLSPARQTASWVMRPLAFLERLRAAHGDVFTVRMVDEEPWVMLSDPELIRQVFAAPADVLHAGEGKRVLEPMLGSSSLLLLDREPHMRQRKLLLPPFQGSRLERHEQAMRTVAERAVGPWAADRSAQPAWPRMQAIALEVILRTVFGMGDGARLDALREALGRLAVPGNAREGRSQSFRAALRRVDELVYDEMRRARADPGLERRDDVLALLVQARDGDGVPMSDVEIRDELMTLVVAGHETAATTLAWALERLAREPEALARAEAEAPEGGGPYTNAVIQETLRLRPALPMVARLVKEPYELAGYTIPPGVTIAPCALLLHHRPDIYPDPTAFRPERFLDSQPGTYTWIPFGGGVRRCIGAGFAMLEMRVVLATLLAHATVRAAEPEPEPMRRRAVTLRPARGAQVILEPRS